MSIYDDYDPPAADEWDDEDESNPVESPDPNDEPEPTFEQRLAWAMEDEALCLASQE